MSFHTPGGHDAKRRRIEAANATLRKPFRSPLVNRQHHETPGPAATDSVTPHTPAPTRGSRHAPNTASPLSTSPTLTPWSPQPKDQAAATAASESLTSRPARRPLPIKNQITPRPQPQPQPRPQLQPRPRPGSQCAKRGGAPTTPTTAPQPAQGAKEEQQKQPGDDDDEEEEDEDDLLTRLATAQRTLHSHLRAAQSRLALVRQAAQIERQAASSSSSAAAATGRPVEPVGVVDLTGLIGKWKGASRLAAEEVFGLVRGRVERMGGVKAWRESQRRQREFYAGGLDEAVVRKGGSVGDGQDEDGEWGRKGEGEGEAGESEESEEFTMIMMLQSLNIDPDVLGYDPVEDRWRD